MTKKEDKAQKCIFCRQIDHYRRRGYPTCIGGRICMKCENQFKRKPIKLSPDPVGKKHDRLYERFLAQEAYPEIQCSFKSQDGMIVVARLRNNKVLEKV